MKKYLLPFLFFVFIGAILAIIGVYVTPMSQSSGISSRLESLGVPVKEVKVISQSPLAIEIDIQSTSSDSKSAPLDGWYMALAVREATFNFRVGARVESFTVNVFNTKGENINNIVKTNVSQGGFQSTGFQKSALNNQEAEATFRKTLEYGDLDITEFSILPINATGDTGQVLSVKATAKDINDANNTIQTLFNSFYKIMWTGNSEYHTYLVLGHLQLFDPKGVDLADFTMEIEAGVEFWYGGPGMTFYPYNVVEPIPTSIPTSPLSRATPYPTHLPSDATSTPQPQLPYPPPATATLHPYP